MLSQMQVSRMLDVGVSTLHRYVAACEGELSTPSRQSHGLRFTEADVVVLRRLQTRMEQTSDLVISCAWCGKELGSRPGAGVSGHSHGMCPRCAETFISQYEVDRALLAG
ncbi:MAG: hypothetical protein ACYC5O_00115 [Anaerolineae bacterium]